MPQKPKVNSSLKHNSLNQFKTKKVNVRCLSSMKSIQGLKSSLTSSSSSISTVTPMPRFSPSLKADVGIVGKDKEGKSTKSATELKSLYKATKAQSQSRIAVASVSTKKSDDFTTLVQKETNAENESSQPTGPSNIKLTKASDAKVQKQDFAVVFANEISVFGEKFRAKIENLLKVKESQIIKLRQMNTTLERKNSKLMEDLNLKNHNSTEIIDAEKRKCEIAQSSLASLKSLVVPLRDKMKEQQAEIVDIKNENQELKANLDKNMKLIEELTNNKESLIKELNDNKNAFAARKDALEKDIVKLAKTASDAQAQSEKKSKEILEFEAQFKKLKASYEKESKSSISIETQRQEIVTLKSNITNLKKDLEESKSKLNESYKVNEDLVKGVEVGKENGKALADLRIEYDKLAEKLSDRTKMLEISSNQISKKEDVIKDLRRDLNEEKRKSTGVKATQLKRKRKTSDDANNSKKSRESVVPDVHEKPVLDQNVMITEVEERQDDSSVSSNGLSLLGNIDLFTASLTSARKEIESSSVFVSNDSIDVQESVTQLDVDQDISGDGRIISSASKVNPKIKITKHMSVEEKMKLLFDEDSSEDESTSTTYDNEKVEELPVSYSPAKTSKVSPVISSSLPVKPKIYLKDLRLLSWNSLWPHDVEKKDEVMKRMPRQFDGDEISKQDQVKIDKCVEKCFEEVGDVVRKCLKKFLTLGSITQTIYDSLATEFTREFQDAVVDKYLVNHSNLLGFELTREDKGEIVDKIILHFNIQDVVKNQMKTTPSIPTNQFPEICQKLTREFYGKLLTQSLGRKENAITLSEDFKQQIICNIKHKYNDNIVITRVP